MDKLVFLGMLTLAFACLYRWLFRVLPRAHWQFLAVLPKRPLQDGDWTGRNLTWYGFFTACAGASAVLLLLFLTSSVGVEPGVVLALALLVLAVCLPAAKWIAVIVEKNPHGFTVGGASFVGIVLAPLLLWLADFLLPEMALPLLPMLAAMSIAYVLGEGIGRLACISFGCCYGRPVQEAPAFWQMLVTRYHHVFEGSTKKIAFAGNMEGVPVIPVQAITSSLFTALALISTAFFLYGHHEVAFGLSLVGGQLWRLYSETLRADYRGGAQHVSVYQVMALLACGWGTGVSLALPAFSGGLPSVHAGLAGLWAPEVLLCIQMIWVVMFFFSGSSTITGSALRFHLVSDCHGHAPVPMRESHNSGGQVVR